MTPTYKLAYFAAKALAEPIRFILSYGGAKFTDVRFEAENWPSIKPSTPFGQVPMLEIDGKTFVQHTAICRYLAKQYGLAGKDDLQNMEIDIVVDTITDLRMQIIKYANEADEALKAKLKEPLVKETLPLYLPKFDEMVKNNGGYFVGRKLTWVDLYWVGVSDFLSFKCGQKLNDNYPNLESLEKKVLALPGIKEWVAKRPVSEM